mgnify:CR=1 FL=1
MGVAEVCCLMMLNNSLGLFLVWLSQETVGLGVCSKEGVLLVGCGEAVEDTTKQE